MGKKKDLKQCKKLLAELLYETKMVTTYLKDIDKKLKSNTSSEESTENNDILYCYTDVYKTTLDMLGGGTVAITAIDKVNDAVLEEILERLQANTEDTSGQRPHTFDEWMEIVRDRKKEIIASQTKSLDMEDIQRMCPKEYW